MRTWHAFLMVTAGAAALAVARPALVRSAAAAGDEIGLSPSNSPAQNAAALTRAFANPSGGTIRIPAGTFTLPCGSSFVAAGPVSLIGAGMGQSVLRLDHPCLMPRPLMQWVSKSGVHLSGFQLDLNNAYFDATRAVLSFEAYRGNASGLQIDRISVTNGTSPSLQLAIAATNGFTYSDVLIENNQFEMTPARTQNQCIALTTVNNSGKITGARIRGNVCRGSGIQGDGEGTVIADNDVSGFQFGQGIFIAFVSRGRGGVISPEPSARNCVIRNNFIHDTPQTTDVNRTAAGGIENNCVDSLVVGNRLQNLGGPGFFNFANGARYVQNRAVGVGYEGSDSAGGDGDRAAFVAFDNGSGIKGYQSQGVTFDNNEVVVQDERPKYGYFEEPYHRFTTRLGRNGFNGSVRAQVVRGPNCKDGPC